MKSNPTPQQRHSIRVAGYDYSQPGAYFVTVCTQDRECILDDPILRKIIEDVWLSLPTRYPGLELDEFIIMPNHIHFILWLNVGATLSATKWYAVARDAVASRRAGASFRAGASPAPTLGEVVGAFKSLVFKAYRNWVESHDPSQQAKFWQRNYYEHIIRNNRELEAIRQYIIENPANWELDRDNLNNCLQLPPPQGMHDYLHAIKDLH